MSCHRLALCAPFGGRDSTKSTVATQVSGSWQVKRFALRGPGSLGFMAGQGLTPYLAYCIPTQSFHCRGQEGPGRFRPRLEELPLKLLHPHRSPGPGVSKALRLKGSQLKNPSLRQRLGQLLLLLSRCLHGCVLPQIRSRPALSSLPALNEATPRMSTSHSTPRAHKADNRRTSAKGIT